LQIDFAKWFFASYIAGQMKWIALLASFFVLTGSALAAGSDEQYLDIYNHILQADGLLQAGQSAAAAVRYAEAKGELLRLQADHPDWNPQIVKFRLDYLDGKLQALSKYIPSTNALSTNASPEVPSGPAPIAPTISPAIEQEMGALRERIRSLTDANMDLSRRLKEALSVQPAGVSSQDMAKAQEKIVQLQKEKDLLTVTLEQAKASHTGAVQTSPASSDQAEVIRLKEALADSEKKLAEASGEIDSLRAARTAPAETPSDAKAIADERDKLKLEVAQLSKDLADSEAHQQAAPAPAQTQAPASNSALEELRAKIAVLEAQPVPLTPEETAILKENSTHPPAKLPTPTAETPTPRHIVHSSKDLPPGAGALMADAARASMERDYAKAEQKYLAVLSEDENNVYVLTYLANAQYAAGHLADCEKTVQRAMALDPDDPATLFLLGILRYRQEKLDEAFTALSRSAEFNPTNAGTQNFLGCVLADKGLRPAAETALRKALQVDPDYADAHYNLALVYASETPPSPELARWHYKRALELGHPKNANLEKLLPQNP
jgi:tetratricopeptide (TPR) repeat protein